MEPTHRPTRATPRTWAPGVAAALLASPVTWHVVRAIEHARLPEPDPRVVLWSERSALLERLGITLYVTAALAMALAPALARRPALAPRVTLAATCAGALAGLVGAALR